MKTVSYVYKWTFRIGIVLAISVCIFHYGHMPSPLLYLSDALRLILIFYGIGFSVALVKVYYDTPVDAPLAEFYDLSTKIFCLFCFFMALNLMTQNMIAD